LLYEDAMKILCCGHHNPHFHTITEYIESAISNLGQDLYIFEDRQHLIPGRIRKMVPFLHHGDLHMINRKMVAFAKKWKPDIAIVTGGDRISSDTIQHLKKIGIRCILWTTDPPKESYPLPLLAAPYYDFIFCLGTEAIELLEKGGIHNAKWLPMACDPTRHHPVECTPEEKKKYGSDVVFVGSYYPERAVLFEHLSVRRCCDLAIYGPGWDTLPGSSPLCKHLKGFHTRPEEWLKIYSASKIILSAHYRDPQGKLPVYQASPRVFEILACGAFQLCDDQRDVFTLFKEGHDLVKFLDGKDLVAKVQYYLTHPEERRLIGLQGRETVLARHTYQDRVKELLTKIGHGS
jgi:spore maturation protein CgeB